ncbi:hypothetical protein BBP40_004356 [Aspergillus hancockii]|nr:hypothetical protein BBP40_004356 [Aspergillus hancockii]
MGQSTILFLSYSELGQANISLAVAHEFLLRSSYDVHFGSFAPMESAVSQLNARATSQASVTTTATFHQITGLPMKEACRRYNTFPESFTAHHIGFRAALKTYKRTFPGLAIPWDGPEYMAICQDCANIIQEIRPAIVVLDPIFLQAIDACNMLRQRYVSLSPNTFKELVFQPKLRSIWKYPVLCSGFPYPLPSYLVLPNIYLTIRMMLVMTNAPRIKELRDYRNSHGVPGPIPGLSTKRSNPITLLPTRRETELPCFLPDHFILCGPILRPCAPIIEEDPELAAWLSRRPTVLVNLGSHVMYTNKELEEFMKGFRMLLDKRPDIQILWKIMPVSGAVVEDPNLPDNLRSAMAEGRVRIETWLAVEPICILSSGHVQCMVHHGGSNSYQEAIQAGVPQVILPVWYDTYDFAWRAEWLGIGVWGSRKTAPVVSGPELGQALIRVLASDQGIAMRDKAKTIASQLGPKEGRVMACDEIISIMSESVQESTVPGRRNS